MFEQRPGSSVLRHLRWRAVFIGFGTDYGSSQVVGIVMALGAGIIFGAQGHPAAQFKLQILNSTAYLLSAQAVGAFFTVLGGFVAGRLAPQARYWNAAAVALLDIITGIVSYGSLPLWYDIMAIALVSPCALLGAYLAGFFVVPEAQPPPLPPPA